MESVSAVLEVAVADAETVVLESPAVVVWRVRWLEELVELVEVVELAEL